MRHLRAISVVACMFLPAIAGRGQAPATPKPNPSFPDTLLFPDGDRLTGKLVRVEDGDAIFRTAKTAQLTIDFDNIADLVCRQRFAVLRKGVRVNRRNAVIGKLELLHDTFIVTTDDGRALAIKTDDVAYAIDDETFEREVARKVPFHEGWSITASGGGSFVRSTQSGLALNTSLSLTRTIPDAPYLPQRNITSFSVSDEYKVLTQPGTNGEPDMRDESHIFRADASRTENIVHSRFYLLGDYGFRRNNGQGLLAEHLFGGGIGVTAFKNSTHRLDIKTDLHRDAQDFDDNTQDDVIAGQKIEFDYQESFPKSIRFTQRLSYSPSYSDPHKYSAETQGKLSIPLFYRFSLDIGAEDSYLNNASPGFKRNTFSFIPSLSYSK